MIPPNNNALAEKGGYSRSMNRTADIFVVGSLVVACSARVGRMPAAGESVRADAFVLELGGKGLNVAIGARRLGARVDGLFAVGDDWLGDFARRSFAGSGLSPDLLTIVPGPTGAGVGFIEVGGENRIAVCPAANDQLSARHVGAARDRIAAASLVIAQFEAPDEPIAAAFAAARGAGARTLLNPSPFRPIAPEILDATDILVVNEQEGAALGLGDELAGRLLDQGLTALVVTRGARGAVVHMRDGLLVQPGFPVDAVDAIGAGDAFIGGFATALASGGDMAGAMRWGCGAGALTAARLGVLDALPDREALTRFLADAATAGRAPES